MNPLRTDEIFADVSTKKNALYIVNPTLRNPNRLLELQYIVSLVVRKFGFNTPISIEEFIDFTDNYATDFTKYSNDSIEDKFTSFNKRLCELKILGLIDFKIKANSIYFYENEFSHISFNPQGYSHENGDFNFLETNSNFLLFILSKRNTLYFLTSLIKEVEKIWKTDLKRDRDGISNIELTYIYIILPLLETKKQHHVKFIVDIIINNRLKYDRIKNNQHNQVKKITYKNFYSSEINLTEKLHRNISFKKASTVDNYIDVLFRTLESTSCFKLKDQFHMSSVTINEEFYSKLSFFLIHDFNQIKTFLLNNTLLSQLHSHEKKFFKQQDLIIQNPIAFRYERQDKARKNLYFSNNMEEHQEKIQHYKGKKKLEWDEFEDFNNLLMTFFVKKQLNKQLTKDNLKYAIKLDALGNVKNSTTGGMADLSIFLEEFTLVVESSLQYGLNARKNEVAPVLTHVNDIYYKNRKKTICFIVFEKQAFHGIQHDYIEHNISNLLFNKDIIYIPVSVDYFYKIIFSQPCSILELSENIQSKLAQFKENIKEISQSRNLLFSDFDIQLN